MKHIIIEHLTGNQLASTLTGEDANDWLLLNGYRVILTTQGVDEVHILAEEIPDETKEEPNTGGTELRGEAFPTIYAA